jgi:hypothetical protein
MDLGRFNRSVEIIAGEYQRLSVEAEFASLVASINAVAANPAATEYAQQFKNQLNVLREKLSTSELNRPSADVNLCLDQLKLHGYVGLELFERVQEVLRENNLAPQVASVALQALSVDIQSRYASVIAIDKAFSDLAVEYVELEESEAEVLTTIPVEGQKTLDEFSREAKDWHRIYEAIAETFDDSRPKLTVKTIASGSWLFYIAATPMVIFGVAKCLKGINQILAELIKSRDLYADLVKAKVPKSVLEPLELHNSGKAKTDLDELATNFIGEFYKGNDEGRKNELRNALSVAFQKLAKKLATGATVSLSIRAPKRATEKTDGSNETLAVEDPNLAKYEKARIEAESYTALSDLKGKSSNVQTLLPSPPDE